MTSTAAPEPIRKTGHDKARAAARRKREEAIAQGLSDAFIAALVNRFYDTIRADAVLGPIFSAQIADWTPHLARMNQFWRSILHGSGEFSGNPMQKHMALPGLQAPHFAQWLRLFYAALREVGRDHDLGEPAQHLVARRARMIADSLLTGIAVRAHGLSGGRAGDSLPEFTV